MKRRIAKTIVHSRNFKKSNRRVRSWQSALAEVNDAFLDSSN